MSGYIKLYRSLLDWEWFDDNNVFKLFIFCLLRANHKEEKWQGQTIKPGQFVTSYEKLGKSIGLSSMQIRTALNKLKITGEITNKTTSKYSIITINNWELYQENNKQNNNQITNKQQTNNNQITTNKNVKNDKNEKNIKEEEDEERPDLKNWYGEYMNVYLTDEQLKKLRSFILDNDFLFFLIDELSSNIAVGRAPRFDEAQPWGHFAMVKKYWDFRRKNPQKFKPQGQEIDKEKRNQEREERAKELERNWGSE